MDFDGDGNLDALIAGNYYSPDFMTGRYDVSTEIFLKGNGKGQFIPPASKQSRISIKGDARATVIIHIKNKTCLIIAVNLECCRYINVNQINLKKFFIDKV